MDEITDTLDKIDRDAICCREYADRDPSMMLVSAYAENIQLWVARLRELVKARGLLGIEAKAGDDDHAGD